MNIIVITDTVTDSENSGIATINELRKKEYYSARKEFFMVAAVNLDLNYSCKLN